MPTHRPDMFSPCGCSTKYMVPLDRISRKWSGKTLADHRGDRKAWLTEMLGLSATDPATYRWEQVQPGDDDYMPAGRRLLHAVADRLHWEQALTEARHRARDALTSEVSATGRTA